MGTFSDRKNYLDVKRSSCSKTRLKIALKFETKTVGKKKQNKIKQHDAENDSFLKNFVTVCSLISPAY